MEITISVNKDAVYREVSKTSEYTGSKMQDDATAYDRILATDEDGDMLDRFWEECKIAVCDNLKEVLSSENEVGQTYSLTLNASSAFDSALKNSMQKSLTSFFVMSITGKWYIFTNKGEASAFITEASSYLEDIKRKLYHKKKPSRPRIV